MADHYEKEQNNTKAVRVDPLTPELLEDGSYLKEAVEACRKELSGENLMRLNRILRDSWVWIPCNAVMSEADLAVLEQMVKNANVEEDPDALVGEEFTSQDAIRLIPDILKSGENYFFPVFTSAEEMGEYGDHFSKVQKHFLEAMNLAWNNERGVVGIVINAFSAPFVVPREVFAHIADMESSLEEGN